MGTKTYKTTPAIDRACKRVVSKLDDLRSKAGKISGNTLSDRAGVRVSGKEILPPKLIAAALKIGTSDMFAIRGICGFNSLATDAGLNQDASNWDVWASWNKNELEEGRPCRYAPTNKRQMPDRGAKYTGITISSEDAQLGQAIGKPLASALELSFDSLINELKTTSNDDLSDAVLLWFAVQSYWLCRNKPLVLLKPAVLFSASMETVFTPKRKVGKIQITFKENKGGVFKDCLGRVQEEEEPTEEQLEQFFKPIEEIKSIPADYRAFYSKVLAYLYCEGYTADERRWWTDLAKALQWQETEVSRQLSAEDRGEDAGPSRQKYNHWDIHQLAATVDTIVMTPRKYSTKSVVDAINLVSEDKKVKQDVDNFLRRESQRIAAELVRRGHAYMDYLKDSSLRLVNPQQIYKIVHGDTFKTRRELNRHTVLSKHHHGDKSDSEVDENLVELCANPLFDSGVDKARAEEASDPGRQSFGESSTVSSDSGDGSSANTDLPSLKKKLNGRKFSAASTSASTVEQHHDAHDLSQDSVTNSDEEKYDGKASGFKFNKPKVSSKTKIASSSSASTRRRGVRTTASTTPPRSPEESDSSLDGWVANDDDHIQFFSSSPVHQSLPPKIDQQRQARLSALEQIKRHRSRKSGSTLVTKTEELYSLSLGSSSSLSSSHNDQPPLKKTRRKFAIVVSDSEDEVGGSPGHPALRDQGGEGRSSPAVIPPDSEEDEEE